jgi:hypothetical protein
VVFNLHIGTDPTEWQVLQEGYAGAVAQELAQATGPVVLPVNYPLVGTLVLSVRSAGTVAVTPPGPHGSHPSGAKLKWPVIRIPSAVVPAVNTPGDYILASDTNLAQLQQDIESAMTNGTLLTVPVMSIGLGAALVLSGASLAYAVLCPAG